MSRPRVEVIGLGPAGVELLSVGAARIIAAHRPEQRWARTARHPAIAALGEHHSFDSVYEQAETLPDVYRAIVEQLVGLAAEHGSVLYAVPGSPLVAERTVELLRERAEIELVVQPSLSFLDLAWNRLGVDPFAVGARLVDGHRFAIEAAGERGPLLVGQCDQRDVLSDIKLAVDTAPTAPVTVLQRLGLADEAIFDVPWDELDREVSADHLTSLWIPRLAAPVGSELLALADITRTLRQRCPWDSVQTHQSLRPYAVEEAYEVIEAINRLEEPTGVDELEEELGDLLFQVLIHATLAEEQGWFSLADVARVITDKLVRRHPHVFADVAVSGAAEVVTNWDQIKADERRRSGRTGPFAGIPDAFPPRLFAEKLLHRAAKAGLDVDLGPELAGLERAEVALLAAARRIIASHPGG
ncbi:MAG: MazG family protein [Acidimicrobiales bacterium]